MSKIILNRQDFSRIKLNLNEAIQSRTISPVESARLLREMDGAELVDPSDIPGDVVTMNSIVKVFIQNSKKEMEFRLVYPKDANLKEGRVSVFSPIGAAVLGCRTGSEINWEVPAGFVKLNIREIKYQPEAAGDFES